ncbi:hypothetical protein AB0E88_06480 [Streptomyces sp. NPDC028635]|uniref:hypothetical protein n=1 Tax=Streptomyces sp. NPDC028635 TaxID=3154800 RepID=UPI0033C4BA88
MNTHIRRLAVAAALACCCALTSCGTERAGGPAAAAAPASPRPSISDTSCDPQVPENTDENTDEESGQTLPDTTSDDQGGQTLPDTTSDDQGGQTLPDTTSDDQGPPPVDTEEDGDLSDRWYSMTREFLAYLRTDAPKADAALAAHVHSASVCTTQGGARTLARVRADYDVGQQEPLDRTARVFARWRKSLYGDHGHVQVLAPAKMTAELDW